MSNSPAACPRALRRLAMAAIAAVLAGCGPSIVSTAPTQVATPAPTAVAAGNHASTTFTPPVTFTLPDGWLIAGDTVDYLGLRPVESEVVGVHLFRSPQPASQALECPLAAAEGVGATAAELVEWIRARPGLVVGDPASVTIGGLLGFQVDVAIVEGWAVSCPFASGLPTVPLFISTNADGYRWVVAGTERLRLSVLDVPGDGTIVVDIDAFDGSLIDDFLPRAQPIVDSLRFGLE